MSARRPEFFFVLCRLTVFAQGKWFTKMLSVCKGQQRICSSRIRRSLERRSHCLEIQIFAAAQSQLCRLFYNRMFVCVNSSSESIIVFLFDLSRSSCLASTLRSFCRCHVGWSLVVAENFLGKRRLPDNAPATLLRLLFFPSSSPLH